MKKTIFLFVVVFSFILCHADMQKVYCKRCGNSYNSIASMSNSVCHKSVFKRHEVYEGFITKQFFCLWCGNSYNSLQSMSNSYCLKNPNGRFHEPYEGSPKKQYTCQYCGKYYNSLQSMSNSLCYKSLNKKHFPLR